MYYTRKYQNSLQQNQILHLKYAFLNNAGTLFLALSGKNGMSDIKYRLSFSETPCH